MSSGSRWAKTPIRASSKAAAITKTSTSRRQMVGELAGAHSYRQDLGRATSMTSIARGPVARPLRGPKKPTPRLPRPVELTALDYFQIQQLVAKYAQYIDTCSNNGYDYAD